MEKIGALGSLLNKKIKIKVSILLKNLLLLTLCHGMSWFKIIWNKNNQCRKPDIKDAYLGIIKE